MSDKILALIVIAEVCCGIESEEPPLKKKRKWMKDWLQKKEEFSNLKLLRYIRETDPLDFKNYMRMDGETFDVLLAKVRPRIQKQDTWMRMAIPPEVRLGITLRFLATGDSFEDLKFSTIVSPQAIGKIVIETCEAIIAELKDHIKLPQNPDEWLDISDRFDVRNGFPHCLGAIDGKHIAIKKPPKSGSYYFNYKKTFSVVLMAVVNADCDFIMVDVGTNGRVSDGGVFGDTKFFRLLAENKLNLPRPATIANEDNMPYVFVGDDAFPLRNDLMKPYRHDKLTEQQELYNRILCSSRVKVEDTFGIYASRFRVLLTTMLLSQEKASIVALTCCYLHNLLRKRRGTAYTSMDNGIQPETLMALEPTTARNPTITAKTIRDRFCKLLNKE